MAASEATLTPTVVSKTAPTNATTNMVLSATASNNGQFKSSMTVQYLFLYKQEIQTPQYYNVTGQALSYNGAAVNIVTTALSAANSLYTLGRSSGLTLMTAPTTSRRIELRGWFNLHRCHQFNPKLALT